MSAFLLVSARVLDPVVGTDARRTLFVDDTGRLMPVPAVVPVDTRVIDASGCLAMPGLLDLHVHFRDPGAPAAEDQASGARAAAAGGFTRVVTMPNTVPAGDSVEWVRRQTTAELPVKILPAACVTRGRRGAELTDLEELAAAGAAAFTDDGAMVAEAGLMGTALARAARLDCCVMDHAVLPKLAGPGVIRDCPLARKLGLPIFPAEAEVEAVRQDIACCRAEGGRLHLQHLSCAESVALIRAARAEGLSVSGEASPHHLAFAAEDIPGDDGNYRMNPPLGTRSDVAALRAGVLDGTLTVCATDHAPHTPATKEQGFLKAAFGVIGLETAAAATWRSLVEETGVAPLAWAAAWTTGPARVLGIAAPALTEGAPADLAVFSLDRPWTYDPAAGLSRSRNSPFAGCRFSLRPILTFCQGVCTYDRSGDV